MNDLERRIAGGDAQAVTREHPGAAPGRRTLTAGLAPRLHAAAIQRRAATTEREAIPSRIDDPFALHLATVGPRLGSTLGATIQAALGTDAPTIAAERTLTAPTATGGATLPSVVQAKMEASFGADFSDVRVHQDDRAASIGAVAYAQGTNLHFAPGAYAPDSASGQELLGHELTHVVQQRAGVVAGAQGKDGAINGDPALEDEADREGAKAARGERATVAGAGRGVQARANRDGAAPIQGVWWLAKDFALGVAKGLAKGAGKDIAKGQVDAAIQAALPQLKAAMQQALQSQELRAELAKLKAMKDLKSAAAQVATAHARKLAEDFGDALRKQLPGIPDNVVSDAIADVRREVDAMIQQSYLAEAIEAVKDIGVGAAMAGVVQGASDLVDQYALGAAKDAVSGAVSGAAEPITSALGSAVDAGRAAQEQLASVIDAVDIPLTFKPAQKLGDLTGQAIHGAATGAASAPIGPQMLDGVKSQVAAQSTQAQAEAGAALSGGVDLAVVVKAIEIANSFGAAKTTDEKLKALTDAMVTGGMAVAGATFLAPYLVGYLSVSVATAVGAATGTGLGTRYVKPTTDAIAETLAPHFEAIGLSRLGTPLRKAAQGVHVAASVVHLGVATATAWVPYLGGGRQGISDAASNVQDSAYAFMGWESAPPERPGELAVLLGREDAMAKRAEELSRSRSLFGSPELDDVQRGQQNILTELEALVADEIATVEALIARGWRHQTYLQGLQTELAEIRSRAARLSSARTARLLFEARFGGRGSISRPTATATPIVSAFDAFMGATSATTAAAPAPAPEEPSEDEFKRPAPAAVTQAEERALLQAARGALASRNQALRRVLEQAPAPANGATDTAAPAPSGPSAKPGPAPGPTSQDPPTG